MSKETQNRALSIKQPFAELIMQGNKKIEYRSIPTNIRGRVYIYASLKPNIGVYEKMGKEPGDFPVGVLVGAVEIVGCKWKGGEYQWELANPKRLKKRIKPEGHPQPVWFEPFKEK